MDFTISIYVSGLQIKFNSYKILPFNQEIKSDEVIEEWPDV